MNTSTVGRERQGWHGGRPSMGAPGSLLPALLLFATLGFLWFTLCRDLSLEWSANEQYSYGWFVPFFAAFLFWLRVENTPHFQRGYWLSTDSYLQESSIPPLTHNKRLITIGAISALALLAPIRLFEVANPDWRPLSWGHALLVVSYTLLVIGYGCGIRAVRHFAFPVCFILVAVPWLTPIEAPLVQGLMRVVASIATETLTLCGIPAKLEGSLIRVNNGVVGVSEACSGVRSLQTSLMIGLLFGELKRLTVPRRFALVGMALAIAFVANCARAFFLVWIAATQNLSAVEHWHDLAGYAIVGLVFVGTIASASALAKVAVTDAQQRPGFQSRKSEGERGIRGAISKTPLIEFRPPPLIFLLSTLTFLLLTESSVATWYRWHERHFVETSQWNVAWPESAPGFHQIAIDENVRSTLRYDAGREATWRVQLNSVDGAEATPGNCTAFFFRWDPGSASILRARAHRPDICLPNTGWKMAHDDGVRSYPVAPGLALPFRHFRFVRAAGGGREAFADAFFCEHEDRVPAETTGRFDANGGKTGNWMRDDRVRVVREGLRNQGQQVMEVVLITSRELTSAAVEADFARLMPGLIKDKGRIKK